MKLSREERDQIERDARNRTMQRFYDGLSADDRVLIDELVSIHSSLMPYADLPGHEYRLLPQAQELGRLHDRLFGQANSELLWMLYNHRKPQESR